MSLSKGTKHSPGLGSTVPPPPPPTPELPWTHLGVLLRHMLLGELGKLHQLRDDLLDIVAVGAVYQGVGHRVQDGLVAGLEAPRTGRNAKEPL